MFEMNNQHEQLKTQIQSTESMVLVYACVFVCAEEKFKVNAQKKQPNTLKVIKDRYSSLTAR